MQEIIRLLFGNISADLDWLDRLKKSADSDKFVLRDAEAAAEEIYESLPEYRNAFSRLAYYLMSEGLYDDADRLFEKDEKSGRQTWWGRLRRAECLALTGDTEKAFAKVQKVYSEFPEAVNGFGHIGWTLFRKKMINEAEAVEIISRDIEQNRITNGLKAAIADIFVLHAPVLAEKLINEAYAANSSFRDLFSESAVKLMRNNDYLTALEWFGRDEASGRISPAKRLTYAELLVRSGKLEKAEENVEAAYNEDDTLKDGYSALFKHASVFDTQRFSFLLAKDRERGRSSAVYDETDAKQLSENYALLSNIARAEKRYGMPVGRQLEVLERMVKEQRFDIGIVDILDFKMRIAQPFDTFIQFKEIFLEENYFFSSETDSPVIIDGGANTGMALAYFKRLYPESVITAFEPNPELFKICEENIKRNGWKNITLHPYALSDKEGTAKFNIYPSMPMGSGLTDRFSASFDAYQTDVQVVRLSEFLPSYTDFIKLDIEGAENSVLKEIEKNLAGGCGAGFIEYHYDMKNGSNPLGEIISILEKNGFDYRITGQKQPDNIDIIDKGLYPEFWSMNIFFTNSWTEFMDSPYILAKNKTHADQKETLNGYLKNFFNLRKKYTEYPSFVQIETTTSCNAKCTFCPNTETERKNNIMTDSIFEKVISDLKNIPKSHNLHIYPFRTGEFLMDKTIFSRIETINKNIPHADICIYSNFNMADKDIVKKLYDIANINFLHISLHSFDPSEYKQKTGLELDRTLDAIRILLEANRHKRLCPSIKILRVEDGTEKDAEFLKNTQYISKLAGGASNVEVILSRRMDWMGYLGTNGEEKTHLPCWRWFGLNIDTDGNIPLCCLDWNSKHIFGNIEKENLLQIYNSSAYRILRENTSDRTKTEYCRKCLHL